VFGAKPAAVAVQATCISRITPELTLPNHAECLGHCSRTPQFGFQRQAPAVFAARPGSHQ